MPYAAKVFNVLIASPSDVQAERGIVREVIHEWNAIHSRRRNMIFQPIGWETHSHPSMSGRPQGVLNEQILKDADLLVVIFWTRIGTPTGEAPGGSVEELEKHIAAGKPAMVYFSSAPVRPDSVDDTQYQALKDFRSKLQGRGLYDTYEDLSDFRLKFSRHLATKINDDEYFAKTVVPNQNMEGGVVERGWTVRNRPLPIVPECEVASISKEEKVLLLEGAEDRNGTIMHLKFIGGVQIQTNGKPFIEQDNPRSRATWEGALEELESLNLVQSLGPKREVYQVTRDGYNMAELLRG
jgi:hypothetical protein